MFLRVSRQYTCAATLCYVDANLIKKDDDFLSYESALLDYRRSQ